LIYLQDATREYKMDKFLSLAQQGLQAYAESHSTSGVSQTGGQQSNSPNNRPDNQSQGPGNLSNNFQSQGNPNNNFNQGQSTPSNNQSQGGASIDHNEAIRTAEHHSGSGSSDLFKTALSFMSENQHKHDEPIDEKKVVESHEKVYTKGDTSNMSSRSLGSAAAMQVFQQFTSQASGGGHGSGSGGSSQKTQLLSMAMAEAAKLFDKKGGSTTGGKQEAVNGAAMTIMKLMVQSKLGGGGSGGGSSGGLGSMMSMASHFLK